MFFMPSILTQRILGVRIRTIFITLLWFPLFSDSANWRKALANLLSENKTERKRGEGQATDVEKRERSQVSLHNQGLGSVWCGERRVWFRGPRSLWTGREVKTGGGVLKTVVLDYELNFFSCFFFFFFEWSYFWLLVCKDYAKRDPTIY